MQSEMYAKQWWNDVTFGVYITMNMSFMADVGSSTPNVQHILTGLTVGGCSIFLSFLYIAKLTPLNEEYNRMVLTNAYKWSAYAAIAYLISWMYAVAYEPEHFALILEFATVYCLGVAAACMVGAKNAWMLEEKQE